MTKGKNVAVALLGVFGFTVVMLWADLLGHSSGFALSTSSIQPLGNARIFFLIGFTSAAFISTFIRRIHKFQANFLRILFPIMGCIGTLIFGFSYSQGVFPSQMLAIIGLVSCGISYYGMAVSFFIELAKVQHFSTAVWIVAVGLFLKTAAGDIIGLYFPDIVQLVFSTALPIIALLCVMLLYAIGTNEYLLSCQSKPLPRKSMQNLLYFFVSASVIVAALRGFSHLGLWGTGYLGPVVLSTGGYLVVGLLLASFTYIALIRNSNNQMLKRYQPAFLVLISGFLIYIIVSQIGSTGIEVSLLTDYFVSAELFGHLLLRAVVFTAMRTTATPGWRIQGISDTAYGVTAIIWAILLQDAIVSVQLLIIIALFFSMAATVRPLSKNPHEAEMALSPQTQDGSFDLRRNFVGEAGENARTSDTPIDLSVSIAQFYQTLAKKYLLSPRETDVFLHLAQGRSRPYISQVLYLADGTVKTHIAHIYKKLNVSSREELLSVVQKAQTEWGKAKQPQFKDGDS